MLSLDVALARTNALHNEADRMVDISKVTSVKANL